MHLIQEFFRYGKLLKLPMSRQEQTCDFIGNLLP